MDAGTTHELAFTAFQGNKSRGLTTMVLWQAVRHYIQKSGDIQGSFRWRRGYVDQKASVRLMINISGKNGKLCTALVDGFLWTGLTGKGCGR